ncbi:hypothetical protein PRUPE_1G071500 [Prunus persica]|uniref:Uncharacterized protein n=1 Tax=Prunus persica TaxID=3760 RepID=M5XEV6_PRUPE|nr:hypothetical protein PRUPE_1G071500 [Prunus persica]
MILKQSAIKNKRYGNLQAIEDLTIRYSQKFKKPVSAFTSRTPFARLWGPSPAPLDLNSSYFIFMSSCAMQN